MEKNKKKLDDQTKAKLIYSGELLIFAAVFIVIGVLIAVGIISVRDWKQLIFNWGTLVGGFILIGDFIWLLCSKKRRAKNSLADKISVLPVSLALIPYDIYALATGDFSILPYVMGAALCYLGAAYLFQAIYHWFFIHPGLVEIAEDEQPESAPNGGAEGDETGADEHEEKED